MANKLRQFDSDAMARLQFRLNEAERALDAACREARRNSDDARAEETMWKAFARFEVATDDLREAEYGFRQTFPHPNGARGVHVA